MARQSNHSPEPESEEPPEVWIPADSSARGRKGCLSTSMLFLVGILVFFFAVLLGFAAILSWLFFNSDMIVPGVQVLDVNVGSMTRAEAASALQEQWQQQQIVLEHSTGSWPVSATELGMTLDAEATVENAYAQGRSLDKVLDLLQGGLYGQPVWLFDATVAASYLTAFAPQLSITPINASVRIERGNILEIPAADGRALDMERTMAYLIADPTGVLTSGRLPIATKPALPTVTDVSELAAEARRLLSTTVTLHAYDPVADEKVEWIITPEEWGTWLSLTGDPDGKNPFEWVTDQNAAEHFLATQLPGLGDDRYLDSESLIPALRTAVTTQQPAVSARIFHHPSQHVVQSGETLASIGRAYGIPYPWIQQANPNSEFLQAGSTITVPSADEMLPLPVVENKRVVVNISQQRAWVYEDGQLKWEWPVSTGIDDSPTAPGIFQIQNHETNAYASNWDLWMPNFMGIYRPVPVSDFMNGFHGFPTRNGSTLLWTGDLGHQVTYGCVLLSSENASLLYDWAEEGVVVEIQP